MHNQSVQLHCLGWWEQSGLGRQSMEDLVLTKMGFRLSGSGRDRVSSFDLQGTWTSQGWVELVKHYHHLHQIMYCGQYDGEGTVAGQWTLGLDQGRWAIKVVRVRA